MATKGPKRDLHTILVAASIKRKGGNDLKIWLY